jgi:Zn-dependent metalloprotease
MRALTDEPAIQQLRKSAEGDLQIQLRPGNQTIRQIRGGALAPPSKKSALQSLAISHEQTARKFFKENIALMRLSDPDNELALFENERDELGHRHLRFRQQHKGLTVWPAELGAHFDHTGSLTVVEGAYVPTPDLASLKPVLNGEDAIARARTALGLTEKISTGIPLLIIYAPIEHPPRLGWKLELTASLTEAWLFVVDAQDGAILHQSSRVCDTHAPGSGVDLSGATRTLNVWQAGQRYYMVDTSKGSFNPAFDPILDPRGVITIVDANGATPAEAPQSGVIVTANSPTLWNIPAAVSAAYNFSETFDYFLKQFGRNSIDGQGGNITAIVRVGNYNNASWNGNLHIMLFGDVMPFAGALDVVGHELAHGVTQASAGLIYQNQSGALNEAFSDIFGEMVEARTRGQTDWILGSDLGEPVRNLKNPGAIFSGVIGRPYPSRMTEFAQLPNTSDTDHGGVHINSSIINHAFYLLAEGMNGAIGLQKAGSIFYRALTQHLFAQSEFIDCRLACVVSAEELYGKGSTEARQTGLAFDGVEIFAAPTTPEPTPLPTVPGADSLLFVNYDPWSDAYVMGRREAAQNDDPSGSLLAPYVSLGRPAITGDGSLALFVSEDFDLCVVETANPDSRECLGFAGKVHSVAISPDSRLAAFVLRDPETGNADGKITVLDLVEDQVSTYNLVAPSVDGVAVDTVLYADSMTFTTDSSALIYDALSQLQFGNGPNVQRWSLYSLRFDNGVTSILVPPQDGIDTGNPSVGRAGNRYVVYDARQVATGTSVITVLDLFTGESAPVATAPNAWSYPSFLGDESGVVYSAPDPAAVVTGFSLFKQELTTDRLHAQGGPTLWYDDANLGVVYRRGFFQGTNSLPAVSLEISADEIPALGTVTITATASDPDGSISHVEFYAGSIKLAQVETAPYAYTWQNVPAGNHLIIARAVDNIGGTKDSSPRLLTVSGTGNPNSPPTVNLTISADQIAAQGTVTLTAAAADRDGTITLVEFYNGSAKLAQVETPPYVYVWENIPAGNHLLTARATDNEGGTKESTPRFLTVTVTPPGDKPQLSIESIAQGTVRLKVSGPPGYYIISMAENLNRGEAPPTSWVDIYPVTIDDTGIGTIEDTTAKTMSRLFFRVRRDE